MFNHGPRQSEEGARELKSAETPIMQLSRAHGGLTQAVF